MSVVSLMVSFYCVHNLGFFKVYKVNIHLSLTFCAVLDEVSDSANTVCIGFSRSESSLFLS